MRQIILDTETTGVDTLQGHRIIEIGAVEIVNRRKTGNHFHYYLNPERAIDDAAYAVHGISDEDVRDKPRFADIADEFVEFIRGAELIIHNAPFDVGFLNAELKLLGRDWGALKDHCSVLDTLEMARERHPGQKNTLDALCDRYGVDNSGRDLHGALLDAQILLDIYLAMTGGQTALSLDEEIAADPDPTRQYQKIDRSYRLTTIQPTEEENAAHEQMLANMEKKAGVEALWRRLSGAS